MEEKLRKKLKSESRIILFGLVILLGLALYIGMFSLVVCLGLDKATEAEKQDNLKIILAAVLIFMCGSAMFLKIMIPVGKDYQLLKKHEYRIIEATFIRYDYQKNVKENYPMRAVPLFCDTVTREILTFPWEEELEQDVCYRIGYLPNTRIAVIDKIE